MAENVRDLELARAAYNDKDIEKTKIAHRTQETSHKSGGGGYMRSIIFGALDGIVTTFATISGVAGANYGLNVVVTLGFSALIADAISMGLGDYISLQAELDWSLKEKRREEWELEHVRSSEIEEMVQLYREKGISEDDAMEIINRMAKYDQFFVDHMMVMELGIIPPDESDSPKKSGAVTFASFLVFGSIPLLAYLIFSTIQWGEDFQVYGTFVLAAVITGISLFCLGLLKGRLVGSKSIRSGFWVLLNGGIAAGAAFLVAYLFAMAVPDECEQISTALRSSAVFALSNRSGAASSTTTCLAYAANYILETRSAIQDISAFCQERGLLV